MSLFQVYPLYDIEPVKGLGEYLWDKNGVQYLDLYGGHAVISIGHTHPHYLKKITEQINKIGFYSNSIHIGSQEKLAERLSKISGCEEYNLFLCNSGAEANENALKLASFANGRKKIIAFKGAFHGRTSLAVACTDNPSIIAPINENENIVFLPLNDLQALENEMNEEVCAVIIEGIQGVGGIQLANFEFLRKIKELCTRFGAYMIADSVQCGYGRTGNFFYHDLSGIKADIYTMAKGMGNGFPIAGILISPVFKAKNGMLGTTFGGNHLACEAALAVLDVIEQENLIENAENLGNWLMQELKTLPHVKEIRGKGLMIGIELDFPIATLRDKLIYEHKMFTGNSSNKNTLRLLPALNIAKSSLVQFLEVLRNELKNYKA